jgi:tetratricopeptide (TPR) repeat protein
LTGLVLVAATALLGAAPPGRAQSPLVAELQGLALRYHEHPERLDTIRAELERAVQQDPHPDTEVALARASFLWGEVRARTDAERLSAYAAGREAARRAAARAPDHALAHLFYGLNTARWGQVRGVLRSLFLLPEVRRAIRRTRELDPTLPALYALAGHVDAEVPAALGGSLDRAETAFRTGLRLDPHFTSLRVGLGKVLLRQGRRDEARRELRAVLDEPTPTSPADWTMRDGREARALLSELER